MSDSSPRNVTRTLASELIGRNIRINAGKLGKSRCCGTWQALLQQILAKRFAKPQQVDQWGTPRYHYLNQHQEIRPP